MSARQPAVWTPARLGRYELLSEIASGGMGTVHLARVQGPVGFEKLAAVKCIHGALAQQRSFVDMFLDEARITAQVSHPNVCSVFDAGCEAGTYYLAMEYLSGETLASILERVAEDRAFGSSPHFGRVVARIVADACRGLHAAHELKDVSGRALRVIHRDATPSNIFVTYEGHVKVVDFGVAHAVGRLHQTSQMIAKGKLAYMPPEQLANAELDRRVDVFAIGVTLWEAITHERLFMRDSHAATVAAILSDPIAEPRAPDGTLIPELAAIAMKALSRQREHRHASALELAEELEAYIAASGPPVTADRVAALVETFFAEDRAEKQAEIAALVQGGPRAVTRPERVASDVPRGHLPTVPIETPSGRQPPSGLVRKTQTDLTSPSVPMSRAPLVLVGIAVFAVVATGVFFLADALMTAEPEVASREPATMEPEIAEAPPATREEHASAAQQTPSEPEPAPSEAGETTSEPEAAPSEVAAEPTARRDRRRTTRAPREERAPVMEPEPVMQIDAPPELHAVSVTSPGGWADVFVGGRRIGRTPTQVRLPPGQHVVEFRVGGTGPPVRRTVDVPAQRSVVLPSSR
jgi:serine/threonine-protein kinase